MSISILLDELRAARKSAAEGSTKRAVLDRVEECLTALHAQAAASDTPERTVLKVQEFLAHVAEAHARLGARFHQPAFALNVLGEAMARADLISKPIVEAIQVGLYFFGFDQIEKRWSSRAAVYSGIHADHLQEYLGRETLKTLVAEARARMAGGRVFCLTWNYLNSLRKAYWRHCRRSEDALDVAVTGELPTDQANEPAAAPQRPIPTDPGDRVTLMLGIFQKALTARQRWIYLAKNRASLGSGAEPEAEPVPVDPLAGLLRECGSAPAGGDLGWTEIAQSLGINEKTAKREYLRSLHTLLKESSEVVFGAEPIPSNYVRRVLESIRAVVYEKDLRLKDKTGRGLGILVEKWEVALRFVLNHHRVPA